MLNNDHLEHSIPDKNRKKNNLIVFKNKKYYCCVILERYVRYI